LSFGKKPRPSKFAFLSRLIEMGFIFMKKQLLIATHNKAKLGYFQRLLDGFELELLSLADFGIDKAPIEDGLDENENSLIKARYYTGLSGLPSLADDAGMYIPALGGMPGVQVRRWGGRFSDDISDKVWLDFFMDAMRSVADEERLGYFKISRAVAMPDGREWLMKWEREFKVLKQPNWHNYKEGWPMSAVTIDTAIGKSFMELSEEEKLLYESDNLVDFERIFNEVYNIK
jgi:XTP/dITP diphosphohydrolase